MGFIARDFDGYGDISFNPNIPGMLGTREIDKTIALWDTFNIRTILMNVLLDGTIRI